MTRNFVSIGNNLQRGLHVRRTLGELRVRDGKVCVSMEYATPTVGFAGEPFLNRVPGFDTDLQAEEWAGELRDAQARNGLQCSQARDWLQDERGLDLRQQVSGKCYADMWIRLNFDVSGMHPIESSPSSGQ